MLVEQQSANANAQKLLADRPSNVGDPVPSGQIGCNSHAAGHDLSSIRSWAATLLIIINLIPMPGWSCTVRQGNGIPNFIFLYERTYKLPNSVLERFLRNLPANRKGD